MQTSSTSDQSKLVIHLSDLHLFSGRDGLPTFWEHLLDAVRGEVHGENQIGIVISGDVFDTHDLAEDDVKATFARLLHDLRRVTRSDAPVLVVPGNHDRRSSGLIRPWTEDTVSWMNDAAAKLPGVHVVAIEKRGAHARIVERKSFLDLLVVAYDSTHTYSGVFSAGGHVRADDLFALPGLTAAQEPVLFVVHHHLIPTPITDVERVDTSAASLLKRLAVGRLLPALISFGDHEEIFMTAFGAGSLLSSLHALDSAVIVLHGHKHYPAARSLTGLHEHEGDVLVVSAGSAGVNEPFAPTLRTKMIWPSFNRIRFKGTSVEVDTVHVKPTKKETYRQRLLSANREGARWRTQPLAAVADPNPTVSLDESKFVVKPGRSLWGFHCSRTVKAPAGVDPWDEPVELPSSAKVVRGTLEKNEARGHQLRIAVNGTETYEIEDGLCGTSDAAATWLHESASPFEWLGLVVRRSSALARLSVDGLPKEQRRSAFATVTDLATGIRRPIELRREADGPVVAEVANCPAKRLLQVFWRIRRDLQKASPNPPLAPTLSPDSLPVGVNDDDDQLTVGPNDRKISRVTPIMSSASAATAMPKVDSRRDGDGVVSLVLVERMGPAPTRGQTANRFPRGINSPTRGSANNAQPASVEVRASGAGTASS